MLKPDWRYFDLEKGSDFDFITRDFDFFFQQNSSSVIIDEAQLSQALFRELRGVVDQDRQQKGRFILTGSSSSELRTGISESLAGRVAIIEIPRVARVFGGIIRDQQRRARQRRPSPTAQSAKKSPRPVRNA